LQQNEVDLRKACSDLSLYDPDFKKIKDLDRIEYPDPGSQELNALYNLLFWTVGGQRIFSTSQDRGYEIFFFASLRMHHPSITSCPKGNK
jgi:hypothetical protein